MNQIKFLAVLISILTPYAGFGDFLPELYEKLEYGEGHSYGSFAGPNEATPGSAIKIFSEAPKGVYVGLGTERGFISAALAPHVTHLLLTDYDLGVVRFNRVNIALLRLARNRNDYLHLRLSSSAEEWRQRACEDSGLNEESKLILTNARVFNSFQIRQSPVSGDFLDFLAKPGDPKSNIFAFEGANYLYDDSLFHRLRTLAQQDKIQSIQLDYSKPQEVSKMLTALEKANLNISVFDFSNAWQKAYNIGVDGLKGMVDLIRSRALPNSVLLLTDHIVLKDAKGLGKHLGDGEFGYVGVHFGTIQAGSASEKAFYDLLRMGEQRSEEFLEAERKNFFLSRKNFFEPTALSQATVLNPHCDKAEATIYLGWTVKLQN